MKFEAKFLSYGLVGFSSTQFLGLLFSGFNLSQAGVLYLIFCLLVLFPGFLEWSARQSKVISPLSKQQIFSCFIPCLIGVAVLSIGFIFGVAAGL